MIPTNKAYTINYYGQNQQVIDDSSLMEWAAENRLSPREAQIEALRNEIVPLRYTKNFRALNLKEQLGICRSRVFVCGCGGLGGSVIELLARVGVGFLRIVDGDVFAPSNLNRQRFSETHNLTKSKALVVAERVKAINPLIEVEGLCEVFGDDNADHLVQGMNLVVDALDSLPARFALANAARHSAIPFVHAAVAGWWGQISTFMPESALELGSIYRNRRSRDPEEEGLGVLGTTAAVIGSLEAFEAIRILSGRVPAYADRLLYFDGESGEMTISPLR